MAVRPPIKQKGLIALALAGASLVAVTGAGLDAAASRSAEAPAKTTSPPGPLPTTPGATAPVVPSSVPDLTTGPTTSALPSVDISTLPPTTLLPPPPAPTYSPGPGWTIESEVGSGPQFLPTAMLPPTSKHGWLMIGDYRSNPGAVSQVVVYTASTDSPTKWVQAAFTGEEQPTSVRAAVNAADGNALILGSADGASGPSPAAWTFDGTTLARPEILGPETPFGRVSAAAIASDGTVYALMQRYVVRRSVTFELGVRAPAGPWTFRPIDLDVDSASLGTIAVSGTTIVLGGSGRSGSEPVDRAMAFTSTDGGATFATADTTSLAALDRSTYLGSITSGPNGFYASACLEGQGAQRQAIVTSPDGRTWSELAFTGPAYVTPLYTAGCDEIAVDEEGGIWLVGFQSFDAVIYRVLGGAVDRAAVMYVEGELPPFDTSEWMQMTTAGGTVAAAVPQVGGPLTGFAAVADLTGLDEPRQIQGVGEAPAGREIFIELSVLNDLGNVIGLVTYPQVVERGESVLYRRRVFPYTIAANGAPTPTPDATPLDPETGGGIEGVVSLPTGDVALGTTVSGAEPSEGTIGDVSFSRRDPGGEWTPLEVVLGGDGGQIVTSVVVVGGVVVAVGDNVLTNPTTQLDEGKPFVLFGSGDGTFSRIDLDVNGSPYARPTSVCAMPDGHALVVGFDYRAGLPFTALVDLAAGTAQVTTPTITPEGAYPSRCVGAREGAFVEVAGSSSSEGSLLYETRDGVTFTHIDVLAEDDSMLRIRSGAAGIAIVGVTGPASEDAFIMFGPTIDQLERIPVPAFEGAGVQVAQDVVIGDDTIYVIGTINNSPLVWPIRLS